MTIYYLSFWNGGSAIDKKILSKIKYLNIIGQPCQGLFVTNLPVNEWPVHENVVFIELAALHTNKLDHWFKLRNAYFDTLLKYIGEHLTVSDMVMHRFPTTIDFSFYRFIRSLPVPVYVEHNTKEWEEASRFILKEQRVTKNASPVKKIKERIKTQWLRSYYWYADRVWKKKILQLVTKGVSVCYEIDRYEKKYFTAYPTVMISNSIDVSAVMPRTVPAFDGSELSIVMVSGWESEWLGLDLLIDALIQYKGSVKVKICYVGEVFEKHKARIQSLSNCEIRFIDYCTGDAYSRLFNEAHIAIGSLALYRLNLKEASNLKTRDYMARGIPFVIGYEDTDLINDKRWAPYYLQFDNPENGIDLNKIIAFVQQIMPDRQHPADMHALAMQTVHTPVKMNILKQAIQSVF